MFDESFYIASGVQSSMCEILSGEEKKKKVQKMGGFQVCNEASMALLAHKQTRASVMSVHRNEVVGAGRTERGA